MNYVFPASSSRSGFSLPTRGEYITTKGNKTSGPTLLYGVGSSAWSFTVTPTYQYKIYFIRGEASYVSAETATAGSAFGLNGMDKSQLRGLVEVGALF